MHPVCQAVSGPNMWLPLSSLGFTHTERTVCGVHQKCIVSLRLSVGLRGAKLGRMIDEVSCASEHAHVRDEATYEQGTMIVSLSRKQVSNWSSCRGEYWHEGHRDDPSVVRPIDQRLRLAHVARYPLLISSVAVGI